MGDEETKAVVIEARNDLAKSIEKLAALDDPSMQIAVLLTGISRAALKILDAAIAAESES